MELIRNLALFGRHGGEHCYLLSYVLAAAVWGDDTVLFEIDDVKNPSKLFTAILAEKNVLRHGHLLLACRLYTHGNARLEAARQEAEEAAREAARQPFKALPAAVKQELVKQITAESEAGR